MQRGVRSLDAGPPVSLKSLADRGQQGKSQALPGTRAKNILGALGTFTAFPAGVNATHQFQTRA